VQQRPILNALQQPIIPLAHPLHYHVAHNLQEERMSQATSDATFTNDVLSSQQPVLVDFWAPWCGPCRMVGPIIEQVGEKTAGKAKVFKLNVDENPETASRYGITGIPTVMVYRNGQVAQQFVGVKSEQVYLKALEN
jgi:thioredoxin 1